MTQRNITILMFMLILLNLGGRLAAQDSLNVVILSPRVGPLIDCQERTYFKLFSQFDRFDSAEVLKSVSGNYFVHLMWSDSNHHASGELVRYSESLLLRIAERIDHFEALESGAYHVGDSTTNLLVLSDRFVEVVARPVDTIEAFTGISVAPGDSSTGAAERFQRPHARTPDWKVILNSGETVSHFVPVGIYNDSLLIARDGFFESVPVSSTKELVACGSSQFWTGAGFGALIGGTLGAIVGLASYEKPEPRPGDWFTFDVGPGPSALAGGLVGSAVGLVVGGVVGSHSGGDESLDLSEKTPAEKGKLMRYFIDAH